jgi:hypothetical protein
LNHRRETSNLSSLRNFTHPPPWKTSKLSKFKIVSNYQNNTIPFMSIWTP